MSPLQTQPSMVSRELVVYKGTLARNPRYSSRRRIDEDGISTPLAVDQHAANCLEEAIRSFTAIRSRCRSSRPDVTFRRLLPVVRVVRSSSVHCFQTRINTELFRCTRAPLLHDIKILSRSNSVS
ncbi:uncharacterized protein TNCV_1746431 [Trichonephila clavipes]|nr:uncharacterized protein TNCV_1746431 [Trichonephila clavipes]